MFLLCDKTILLIQKSVETILDMLFESKGVIHDVTQSHMMDLSRLRDGLLVCSWSVTFGNAQPGSGSLSMGKTFVSVFSPMWKRDLTSWDR